jgi:eukaryotic-like serine/threonine-protein kinase
MPAADRRHDLLLCLLAVEQNIASVEHLAPLLESWLDRSAGSLADLLIERGLISAGQLVQLEEAAEKISPSDTQTASEWRTLPQRLESTQIDHPSQLGDFAEVIENTRNQTSGRPATIVPGKNDERFNIVSAYAEGGLGEISVAHDSQLGRMVALKQIKTRWADDVDARSRFLQEAQITGRLEHPGIVPVYALGFDASGRPYYAMRFIEGETLQEIVKRFHNRFKDDRGDGRARLLELRKLLTRLIAVCNAIDYAHNRGIIHRDLKPANILLGKYGETLVVDWGLAKVIAGDKLPPLPFQEIAGSGGVAGTVMGTALGTPAYMSPEQAAGRMDELGPQTDIYSLGVIFYHLLTGRLPYEEGSVSGVLEKVKALSPRSPREHSPWVPRPLEAICQKAMAPRPGDRYASTAALADDIERWLADEQTRAYAPTPWERVALWWRHRS